MEPTAPSAQTDEQFTPLASTTPTTVADDNRWSWGAFSLHAYFVIAIRRYVLLIPLIVVLVPLVGPLLLIGYMVYLGMKGRGMAAASSTFANRDEFTGFMKGIDHAGKIMFFVMLAAFAIGFVVAVTIMGALVGGALSGFNDLEQRDGMM